MAREWGWAGTAEQFLDTPSESWLDSLAAHHEGLLGFPPAGSQRDAWVQQHEAVRDALRLCCDARPEATGWGVVFEYELPLEGGRRPDVVVLAGGTIIVLEFKSQIRYYQAHLDQVEAYARDLAEYHEASHGRLVVPVLVMRDEPAVSGSREGTYITDPSGLSRYLDEFASDGSIDLDDWLRAPYAPLPTLVAAARRIFEHEPLPHVRRAEAQGIPQTVDLIGRLIEDAAAEGARRLVFVTGVPGSGKTLVGLRVVYERSKETEHATFLSGNGPLVQVLQNALGSRVFVRDLHAYIRTYGMGEKAPSEHVIVFDEAQRAWDAGYMQRKRDVAASEPELLVGAGEKVDGWSVLVGLVGEGQEIFSGEEGGIAQWADAARPPQAQDSWTIHCPPKLGDEFADLEAIEHPELDLTVSLRTHRAEELYRWVALLLEGSISLAARAAVRMQDKEAYPMYLTRDLDEAKAYVRSRYEGEEDKRYGLLASSHAKNLPDHDVPNHFLDQRKLKVAKWFNAPLDDPESCCALRQPATEFQCQGLEVDMPIVCWGTDYRWDGEAWDLKPKRSQYRQEDPEELLRNVYRVLLTRGRDGLVVFVPPDEELDLTEHALLAAGVRPLPGAEEALESTPA